MQRALADLERQGLLYTNRTSGRYVTEDEEMITKIRDGSRRSGSVPFWRQGPSWLHPGAGPGADPAGERGEERMRQDNDLVVCQGLTKRFGRQTAWTVWT